MWHYSDRADLKVIKLLSCSTQLSMNFVLLINLKLHVLTIAHTFLLNIAEHENFSANKYENANYWDHLGGKPEPADFSLF